MILDWEAKSIAIVSHTDIPMDHSDIRKVNDLGLLHITSLEGVECIHLCYRLV